MPSKVEQTGELYDAMYDAGGYQGVYNLPTRHSWFYPLFKAVLAEVERAGARRVLEVGCGVGSFAELIGERPQIQYRGFDFSPLAIKKAAERLGRTDRLFVGDARDPANYGWDYDAIVCTEVLEHIPDDLDVVAQWKPGTTCICSVPNFDAENHERYFTREAELSDRYSALIAIERIRRIKKPALSDISLGNYVRHLRWNYNKPAKIKALLGLEGFDQGGGWFLFTGKKR